MKNISCILCEKNETKKIADGMDRYVNVDTTVFTLVKCNNCDLVYINPQPSPAELAKYYPSNYPPFIKNDQSVKNIILAKKDVSMSKEEVDTTSFKKVLDFGCGSGRHLLSIREQHPFWELHGFDIGANKEVKEIGNNISIIYDDFDKLSASFKTDYFDLIYMNNVLEHLNNPLEKLQDLKNLLKKDGQIIIEVPNIDSIKFKVFGKYFSSLDIPRHLYDFSPKTLAAICNKAELRIQSLTLNGSTKSTLRSMYYMLGIKKKNLNPFVFKILNTLTKIIGEKKIHDDVIIATVTKI